MTIPPLRPLDAFPLDQPDGRKLIGVRDPLGVIEGVLGVTPEAWFIASHFNGEDDSEALADLLTKKIGSRVTGAIVNRVHTMFSERALLSDAAFDKLYESAREEFARAPSRAAAHSGTNYPADREEFRIHMGGILAEAWDQPAMRPTVVGLISPHIDLERGQITYARAYGALRGIGQADRFIILGTAHGPTRALLVPTRKDYETPLGPVRTDRDAVDRMIQILGASAFDEEFAHKNEHSIEFQAIFIKLMFPNASIVPVLCGSLRSLCQDSILAGSVDGTGADPAGLPEVETAVQAIRAAMADSRRTVIIAGADLAHVGPRFGGPELTRDLLESTETADRAALDFAASHDASGWFRSVTQGGDPRNTCGLAPIYFLLRSLDRCEGDLLAYRRCEAPDQCVTIGAMSFSRSDPALE